MVTLKEESQAYEPKKTLNITDLERVDILLPIVDSIGVDKLGKEFEYKALVFNGIEFRTPSSVLEKIKEMLELKPDLTHVKVTSTGSGMTTRYKVVVA